MTQFLFDRSWEVQVFQSNLVLASADLARKYTQLKVEFEIDKNSESTPNKSKISIYNLNRDSRISYERKGLQILVKAGYVGLLETLFIGDVALTKSERKQADIITTFECGDGEKQLYQAHFEKSYPAGVTYSQIVKDIAIALNLPIGPIIGIENKTFSKGVSFSRSCRSALDTIVKNQGLEWSIQNNALQIIPRNAHNGETAIVISKQTGMIGVPTQGNGFVQFVSLLNPQMVPGRPVQIVSEDKHFNGFYKIRRAKFDGDSHGEKWFVTCEAVKINAIQSLPLNRGLSIRTVPIQVVV